MPNGVERGAVSARAYKRAGPPIARKPVPGLSALPSICYVTVQMNPDLDLDLTLDETEAGLLSHQLGRRLVDLILTGALPPGRKLPSTRQLAGKLGVARTTVVDAYGWLADLGYVDARSRARACVRALRFSDAGAAQRVRSHPIRAPSAPSIDFRPGLPDLAAFPRVSWAKALARSARTLPAEAMGYGDPLGCLRLREALARYLHRCRGFAVSPENVVITAGASQSVDILLRALPKPREIVVETPGPHALRRLSKTYAIPLREVEVDDAGIQSAQLPTSMAPRIAYVIPSHQMPLGCVMSMERRLALIAWAQSTDAYVIEDDYDSEFAFDGRPSVPLAKLDTSGRVIYSGTFSKTLAPALRIGFMVVSDRLLDSVRALKLWVDHGGSTLQQDALASWIEDGVFERHIHRMRNIYRRRSAVLETALAEALGDRVRLVGRPVGMHLGAFVRTEDSAETFCRRAAAAGLGLYPIEGPVLAAPDELGLVMGFGNVSDVDVARGAQILSGLVPPGGSGALSGRVKPALRHKRASAVEPRAASRKTSRSVPPVPFSTVEPPDGFTM